jgi:hypothetical protein
MYYQDGARRWRAKQQRDVAVIAVIALIALTALITEQVAAYYQLEWENNRADEQNSNKNNQASNINHNQPRDRSVAFVNLPDNSNNNRNSGVSGRVNAEITDKARRARSSNTSHNPNSGNGWKKANNPGLHNSRSLRWASAGGTHTVATHTHATPEADSNMARLSLDHVAQTGVAQVSSEVYGEGLFDCIDALSDADAQ